MASPGSRLKSIDGLKGLCCVMIMFMHYFSIYTAAEDRGLMQSVLMDFLSREQFSTIITGDHWLYLFFAISGFLLSRSCDRDLVSLGLRCIKRFLRLFLPVLGGCLISYLIWRTIGYHNSAQELGFFINRWFNGHFQQLQPGILSPLADALGAITRGDCPLDPVFWVMEGIFRGSLIVYLYRYLVTAIASRLKEKQVLWAELLLMPVFLLVCRRLGSVVLGCFAGVVVDFALRHAGDNFVTRRWWLSLALILLMIPMCNWLHHEIYVWVYYNVYPLSLWWDLNDNLQPLYSGIILYLIMASHQIRELMAARALTGLGAISFGIYALHFPAIASLGSLVMKAMPSLKGYVLSCGLSALVTLGLAVLFHLTVERASNAVIKRYDALSADLKARLLKSQGA